MSDPRLTPANGRVAAEHLRGKVEAAQFTKGAARQLLIPVADLLRAPEGHRDRQVMSGETVTLYEDRDGWSFVQLTRDGYVGYLRSEDLGEGPEVTHQVTARSTHVYSEPDFKSPERHALSHLSRVCVQSEEGRFAQTPGGYIPRAHLGPVTDKASDPVAVAELYLGTPYLWGGNSAFGIDCSGLIQAGCLACGIPCPGDSDQQQDALGTPFGDNTQYRRGDLLFWNGHVAWVADPETLLHANVHHMAVAYEPLEEAIARIEQQGDGPVTARKRLGGPT